MEKRHSRIDLQQMEERKMLGTPTLAPEFVLEAAKLPEGDAAARERELFRIFKENCQDDPTDPQAQVLKDLHLEIADALGLEEGGEGQRELRAYTTLGTPLESEVGVDCFFELRDPSTSAEARVTIDAAPPAIRQLRESRSAENHVLINRLPDAAQEEERYLERIGSIGEQIALKLRTQLEDKESEGVWKE